MSIGTGVIGGMIAATALAIIFVPLFFRLVTRNHKPAAVDLPTVPSIADPGEPRDIKP